MQRFILAPDSFKGTISSIEVCDIISERIAEHFPGAEIISIPVADGGEGTVDCFLAASGGEKRHLTVTGPLFEPVEAFYAVLPNGTAVIEMAAAAGLPLVENRKAPDKTTTFGVGELIADAMNKGARRLVVGLGGSSTNDGGCGAAAALGVRFYDKDGNSFIPTGGTLSNIERIDMGELHPAVREAEISVMCDINNPMYGENGAAYVFGPQKGADAKMVRLLDNGLRHLSSVMEKCLGKDPSSLPGSGAAGAMGAGMWVFLSAALKPGIEIVLDTVGFNDILAGGGIVFTGEGKIDSQSLGGKVVIGVAGRAKKYSVPVIVIAGDAADGSEEAYSRGVSAIFSTNRLAIPFEKARLRAKKDLSSTADAILRTLKLGRQL